MSTSSEGTLDDQHGAVFKKFKQAGRDYLKKGKVKEALECYQKAYKVNPDERLGEKIKKMVEYLENEAEAEDDGDMINVGNGFRVYKDIVKKLYAYQKEGVMWMWELYLQKKGGVLGDDMGLGKTIQVISFLSGMFDGGLINSVLLVMPVSLMPNWKKEFDTWAPGIKVLDFHAGSKQEKERNLARIQRRGGVLITSYGMLQNNAEKLGEGYDGRKFVWCYVILDEGHKIKNPTKTTKAVYEIPTKQRLVLTGTAIQNNLRELWALFNFTHQGTLLGSLSTFKAQYENPINRAREKDATAGERLLGVEVAQALRAKIQPYFLRRTKAEVLENKENEDPEKKSLAPKLVFTAKKNDLVVWIFLSHLQKTIYSEFLHSDEVKNILMTKKSPLVQLTILKKICDHPRLLSRRACVQLGMHENMTREEIEEFLDNDESNRMDITDVPDETLLEESGKMMFVLHLLTELKREGHRTLFFSQSRKILDITQRILTNRGFSVTRLDGTVTKMADRDRLVSQFQDRARHDVFLLTTQVGGVGLTLTAADRVVIYDPSWNPATDAQAVDRAYRIGQHKNVIVYRLVTCSTVEEKIYRRQIFKDSIIKQTTGKQRDPTRYFTKQELRELFTLEDPTYSQTQAQLEEMHSHNRNTDASLEEHIEFLKQNNIFGISHHDLMFSSEEEEGRPEEFVPGELEAVRKRVEQAEHLIKVEAQMFEAEVQRSESYKVPDNIVVAKPKQAAPGSREKMPNAFPIVIPDEDGETRSSPKLERNGASSPVGNELIDVDSLDSVNQTLGNLTMRGSSDGGSIIVEGSDDELFVEESNDVASKSYVIEESDEEHLHNASRDHKHVEDVTGAPKEGLAIKSEPFSSKLIKIEKDEVKSELLSSKCKVVSPVACKEEKDDVKSVLLPSKYKVASLVACKVEKGDAKPKTSMLVKTPKEGTPSHTKPEGDDEISLESKTELSLPKNVVKEETSFIKQEAGRVTDLSPDNPSEIVLDRLQEEFSSGAKDSTCHQLDREDIRRNLFEEKHQMEGVKRNTSFSKAHGDGGDELGMMGRKRQWDSSPNPSPLRQDVKQHLQSPLTFGGNLQKKAATGSPLTGKRLPSSPLLGSPKTTDLGKPSIKERTPQMHLTNEMAESHRSTSTPKQTPSSSRTLTPRRITPLHVSSSSDRKACSFAGLLASPFQKAMATSLELSPEERNPKDVTVISDDEEDSPIVAVKKTRAKRIISDDSIVISDEEDGPVTAQNKSAAAKSLTTDEDDDDDGDGSSEDEMISQNEEEGWASISQSFSSVE